jgi:hypothetical protein
MPRCSRLLCPLVILFMFTAFHALRSQDKPITVQARWDKVVRVSQTVPTICLGAGPMVWRGSPIHDKVFASLENLGADDVRYTGGGYVYPYYGVAEMAPPTATTTSWNFATVDQLTVDAMNALKGHPVVMNFSSIPAWMFKQTEPVRYPADATKICWDCSRGKELRDPTYREVADYFARVVSWHVKGGFTDELGKWHESGHHYKIDYWEVLNEPDNEHGLSPQVYTGIYDAVVEAIHKVSPVTKFVGMSDAYAGGHPDFFMYFLNPRNHKPGIPLDMISYHFYAVPGIDESPEVQQFSYFYQADRFLEIVGYIEAIRKAYSPSIGTMVNEVGSMLPGDAEQTKPDYVAKPIPPSYWNLSGATYAYVYAGLAARGIDAANASGIDAGPGMWPSLAMTDWQTGQPNARFWALKLIHDNFRPGDKIVDAESASSSVMTQGYVTSSGERKLLIVNKRDQELQLTLPEAKGGKLEVVDQATGSNPPASSRIEGETFKLGGLGVAVVTLPK